MPHHDLQSCQLDRLNHRYPCVATADFFNGIASTADIPGADPEFASWPRSGTALWLSQPKETREPVSLLVEKVHRRLLRDRRLLVEKLAENTRRRADIPVVSRPEKQRLQDPSTTYRTRR